MDFHISEKDMDKLDAEVCTACLEVLIKFLEGKSGKDWKCMQFSDKVSATPLNFMYVRMCFGPFFCMS